MARLTLLAVAAATLTTMLGTTVEARGWVDRHRILQDVNMGEEEVGQLGHEQTVIVAEEKDSTTAKATSSVHVPHKDATTVEHQTSNVEWSDNDIKIAEGFTSTNTTTANAVVIDPATGEEVQQEEAQPGEEPVVLTEEELEQQRVEEENQKIEEGFEAYSNLNADEEAEKLQAKELAKNKKKAEIHLLEPRARSSDNRGNGNKEPCGGTERGSTHYLAASGSRNYLQWKTLKAHKSANCTVRLSQGSEDARDFKVLTPRDGSADYQGSFPCGRSTGFDGKEFRLPNDFACQNCILSFTQEISKEEQIHQCADIVITEQLTAAEQMAAVKAQREGCGGICKNGGQCRNGECDCRDGFEGQFCEDEEEGIAAELIWFFIITAIIVAAILIYWYANEIKRRAMESMGNNRQVDDQPLYDDARR